MSLHCYLLHSFSVVAFDTLRLFSLRFEDWKSEKSSKGQYPTNDSGILHTTVNSASDMFQKGFECSSDGIRNINRSLRSFSLNTIVAKCLCYSKKILDPQGPFLQRWNKIFVLSCMVAISLDPLFFYIPLVDDKLKCLSLDKKLETTASVLRSFTDIFYIIHIIFQFRTGFIAPSSRVFGRGVLVEDSWAIAKRYLSSNFIIDILAVLPLPQVKEAFTCIGFFSLLCSLDVYSRRLRACQAYFLLPPS